MFKKKLKIVVFVFFAFVLGGVTGGALVKLKTPTLNISSGDKLVTGIGGIFFKTENPEKSREWYQNHLGIFSEGPGVNFFWRELEDPDLLGLTVWSVFPGDTDYFGPNKQEYMINYRVRDLNRLLAQLKKQEVHQIGEIEEYSYGRFAWIVDGDGKRVELWEPVYSLPDDGE